MGRNAIDRTGQRFGALVVLRRVPTFDGKRQRTHWLSQCDCGQTTTCAGDSLVGGLTTSCGCGIYKHAARVDDLLGQRFGLLTVVERGTSRLGRPILWRCQCDCGGERTTDGPTLKWGRATSCGCQRTTHGHSGGRSSPTYGTWQNMLARCTNPKAINFRHYGGRGITVCDRWRSFAAFLADMGERPKARTLDRIDVNGNYEPNNCRWATAKQQSANQRKRGRIEQFSSAELLAELAKR